jgi:glycosyltransferase involved in cell wall biosynthesis
VRCRLGELHGRLLTNGARRAAQSPGEGGGGALSSAGGDASVGALRTIDRPPVRLLFITDHDVWPLDSGIALRNYHLATGAARRHDVTLVMIHWADQPVTQFPGSDEFADLHCVPYSSCRFFSQADADESSSVQTRVRTALGTTPNIVRRHRSDALQDLLASLHPELFDVVWVTRGYFGEAVLAAGYKNVIVDLPDLEGEREARALALSAGGRAQMLQRIELRGIQRWERSLVKRVAAVVVCKPADVRAFGSSVRNVHVVANGIDSVIELPQVREQSDELLFVGTLHYGPNMDAVRVFHDEVLPCIRAARPATRFVIVGRQPLPDVAELHDGDSCVVHADVVDLGVHYQRATAVVVPLRLGSGTRIKTMEALAHRKAVVSTAIGIEGIDVRPGQDLLIGELTDGFATSCLRLLGDPSLRERLGESGRARMRERHRWDQSIEAAEGVLRAVAPAH